MKVESKHVINGEIVNFIVEFCGIKVYESSNKIDDEKSLYFIKNEEVMQTLKIGADCGQNTGYISQCDFFDGYLR